MIFIDPFYKIVRHKKGEPSSQNLSKQKTRNSIDNPFWNPINNPFWNPINKPIYSPIYNPIYSAKRKGLRREENENFLQKHPNLGERLIMSSAGRV